MSTSSFEDGGFQWESISIPKRKSCLSPRTVVVAMAVEENPGKLNFKNLQLKLIVQFQFVIFLPERVSGIKLNIDYFHILLKTGAENL